MLSDRTVEFSELVKKAEETPFQQNDSDITSSGNTLKKRNVNSIQTQPNINDSLDQPSHKIITQNKSIKQKEINTLDSENHKIQREIEQKILENSYSLKDQLLLLNTFLKACRPSYLNLHVSGLNNLASRVEKNINIPKKLKDHPLAKELSIMSNEFSKKKKLADREKDQIDNYIKLNVREIFKQIQQLEAFSENLVQSIKESEIKSSGTPTKQLFARAIKLFDPRSFNSDTTNNAALNPYSSVNAAKMKTLTKSQVMQLHFSGMTWWLSKKLMNISKLHISMEEQRIASLNDEPYFSKKSNDSTASNTKNIFEENSNTDMGTDNIKNLPESEQRMLLKENKKLLSEFEKTTDEVIKTQKALLEISTLQSQMSQHLSKQLHQTEQLYNESLDTLTNLEKGNVSLKSAQKNFAAARPKSNYGKND
ncbi:hypothetical protein BB561_000371 [Smittium simulii]|uniref:SNARE-complex protein Syntaxin-18 N-terminal domain-containing protein n=1 Tax=Smittium simulii TaxID=133385 RepID=A0A2T9YZF9_9FUNG|nr:hypothetical protein BB561_000371 [Smittium simulii]